MGVDARLGPADEVTVFDRALELHRALSPYYSVIALAATWAGFGFVWWRRRAEWHRKEFLGQVNFSLTMFGKTLEMRTLLERETAAVWPNAHGLGLLRAAARKTTEKQPFIRLKSNVDRDYLHRSVKNALSQVCPAAFVAAALGAPVRRGVFLFALTCERYPEMRTVKVRVLLIEQETLREWCSPGGKGEQLDLSQYYKTRLRTLQAMYEMDRVAAAGGDHELGRVELGVPA